ncbi:quinoprotein relay system zinc metallohydrolase 2 [Hwanghaeella sp.]|uniref:quinoprotein relay system zinc metallohydrolase 2 n=1 Tax=Hwanghaeella sp. TaxID=2605943 RepID=UPI003CCBBFDA
MFELFLTICLQDQPDICADRLIPVAAETKAICEQTAPNEVDLWRAAYDIAPVINWQCAEGGSVSGLPVTEVADGIFVHQGRYETPSPSNAGDLANIGFVIGEDAVAVIDAGGSRLVGERLYAAIRERTDLPIDWLILTHMHPDHVLGAGVFHDAGAKIVGHPKLADALQNRRRTYSDNIAGLIGARSFLGSRILTPDLDAEEVREIDLGGRRLVLNAHRTAHTDNDMTAFDTMTGTLFTGDLVFAVHTPALDGSILGWLSVLQDLSGFQADRIVPGHGPVSLPWPDGGEGTWNYLATLTEETRRAIAEGESMRTAIEHLGESMRDHWELFDEYNPRNATAAYKELEWE